MTIEFFSRQLTLVYTCLYTSILRLCDNPLETFAPTDYPPQKILPEVTPADCSNILKAKI